MSGGHLTDVRFALTWVPDEACISFSGCQDAALARVRTALDVGVDLALVGDGPGGAEAIGPLRDAGIVPMGSVDGPLGRVARRDGHARILALTATDAGRARLVDALEAATTEAIERVAITASAGVEIVLIADDLAAGEMWLVSPDFAREVLMPLYARAAQVCASAGAIPYFHSDGDVSPLYSDVRDAGFAGVHVAGVARSAFREMPSVAADLGLAVMGGVSAVGLDGTDPVELAAAATTFAAGVGSIVADDGGISTETQLVAYREVVAAVRGAESKTREITW